MEIINFHKRCNKKTRKTPQPKKSPKSPKSDEPKKSPKSSDGKKIATKALIKQKDQNLKKHQSHLILLKQMSQAMMNKSLKKHQSQAMGKKAITKEGKKAIRKTPQPKKAPESPGFIEADGSSDVKKTASKAGEKS